MTLGFASTQCHVWPELYLCRLGGNERTIPGVWVYGIKYHLEWRVFMALDVSDTVISTGFGLYSWDGHDVLYGTAYTEYHSDGSCKACPFMN